MGSEAIFKLFKNLVFKTTSQIEKVFLPLFRRQRNNHVGIIFDFRNQQKLFPEVSIVDTDIVFYPNIFQEFLQALFIARRTYPIAYDKWIREQVEEILGLPDLYKQLPKLFEFSHFESSEIADKAKDLGGLLEEYAVG